MLKEDINLFARNFEERAKLIAEQTIKDIEYKQTKLKNKQDLINDLQYEVRLITDDIINDIKTYVYRSDYNLFQMITPNMFWECWRYKGSNNLKDEDKEKYKKSYKFITNRIKDDILKNNKEFELTSIIDYNYSTFYTFEYKYKNIKLRIDIPMYPNARENNYQELLRGYSLYLCTSNTSCELIYHNLNYEKVADFLENYVKEKVEDNA